MTTDKRSADLKILLFGGSGLIGSRLRQLLGVKYQIIAPTHLQVDVTSNVRVEEIIQKYRPDYIIYAAGLTSVDQAEQNSKLAYLLNAQAPGFLAKKAALLGIPVLYFSTDAVFDGTKKDNPYLEDEKTHPFSEYGRSKLSGEQLVMEASSQNCIVRVISVYSHQFSERKRFIRSALETLKKGERFYGVIDQIANPIYIDDIVAAVDLLIESKSCGSYHLGASNYITNFEFVKKLAKHFNLNENLVIGISFKDFFKGKLAMRAQFCWLDTLKFRKKFGENTLHSVDEGIKLLKTNLNL